jgi:hypothetical protein
MAKTPYAGTVQSGQTVKPIGGKPVVATGPAYQGGSIKQAVDTKTYSTSPGEVRSGRLLETPREVYVGGGSAEASDRKNMYKAGIGSGAGLTDYGVGVAGQGAGMLGQAGQQAIAYGAEGQGIGQFGLNSQNAAIANARGLAGQSTDSLALLQLQQAQDTNTQRMLGMAAQARGGNQAAALRNAQAMGSQNQLVTNQQAAQLRAGEQQAALNRQLGVEQMAAGVGGQQAGLGYGMYGQGIGMLGQAGAQTGQIGTSLAGTGVQQQGVYVGALAGHDRTQAELDAEREKARREQKNKIFDGVMGSVGSFGAAIGGAF